MAYPRQTIPFILDDFVNPSCTKGGGGGGWDDPSKGFLSKTLLGMNDN